MNTYEYEQKTIICGLSNSIPLLIRDELKQ